MKILIVRTIQSDLLSALLNTLREAYPDAKLYLLDNLKQANFTKGQPYVEQEIFWTDRQSDYGIFNVSKETRRKIIEHKMNMVIIPHKQWDLAGFENVISLLSLLRIDLWYHCSIDWKLRPITKSHMFKQSVIYLAAVPVFIILLPFTFLSFLYLFLSEAKKSVANQSPRWGVAHE